MNTEDDNLDPLLGPRLKALYPAPPVPAEVERSILQMPRLHLNTQRRNRRLRWTLWGSTGAVAAAVLLATWIGLQPGENKRPAPTVAADIGDAFYLARQIKAGKADTAWDRNRDGVVNQQDVDALAAEAVRLEG